MSRAILLLVLLISPLPSLLRAQEPSPGKLLIAFASYRDRPKHPQVFFYEHDGVSTGKLVGGTGTVKNAANAEAQPSLSHDGRFCAFTFEIENKTARVQCWDRKEQKFVDLPA